ncbi:hypothetical protein [Silvibacterium sp.]|uniref:hypothetical protein n=1 Tax=Silvibacterium sp. TaxID=1964179 RepID=UPI0039E51135
MQISKDQTIAGHPALTVRAFLRRYRFFDLDLAAAIEELHIDESEARNFLLAMESLGLIETSKEHSPAYEPTYSITIKGNALANASAAKPIRRATAHLALDLFMTRLARLNASREYVYRVESAVLFGSMLADADRLGDVNIAIELEPKVTDKAKLEEWCNARRKLAVRRGTHFNNTMDWISWPRMEVFRVLRARSRALSLHEWDQITRIPDVHYRILLGDRQRIASAILTGQCIDPPTATRSVGTEAASA